MMDIPPIPEEVAKKVAENLEKGQTIYGYPAKDLVIFAEMCRRHGITEQELRDYCLNVEQGYTHGWEEQNREAKEQLQRMLDNIISHAHVFKIPNPKEESNEQQE